jgi:hypothetical protein
MTGGRLRLDRATVVDPVANALPQAEAEGSGRHGGGGSSRPIAGGAVAVQRSWSRQQPLRQQAEP